MSRIRRINHRLLVAENQDKKYYKKYTDYKRQPRWRILDSLYSNSDIWKMGLSKYISKLWKI